MWYPGDEYDELVTRVLLVVVGAWSLLLVSSAILN